MQSVVVLERKISADAVERILRRNEVSFFRRVARGLRESRGTPDFYYNVDELIRLAVDDNRSEFFRRLCARHLVRITFSRAELMPPTEAANIKIELRQAARAAWRLAPAPTSRPVPSERRARSIRRRARRAS